MYRSEVSCLRFYIWKTIVSPDVSFTTQFLVFIKLSMQVKKVRKVSDIGTIGVDMSNALICQRSNNLFGLSKWEWVIYDCSLRKIRFLLLIVCGDYGCLIDRDHFAIVNRRLKGEFE